MNVGTVGSKSLDIPHPDGPNMSSSNSTPLAHTHACIPQDTLKKDVTSQDKLQKQAHLDSGAGQWLGEGFQGKLVIAAGGRHGVGWLGSQALDLDWH